MRECTNGVLFFAKYRPDRIYCRPFKAKDTAIQRYLTKFSTLGDPASISFIDQAKFGMPDWNSSTRNFTLIGVYYYKLFTVSCLVTWSSTSLFSKNMANTSEMKGQGWRVIFSQWSKASDTLTTTLATFLFSSHPKRERDREAHLNYYTSAYNRGRQLSHHKTKLNQTQQKTSMHP